MDFLKALNYMKKGALMKLPSWSGYWYWSPERKTIMNCTKNGETNIKEILNIEDTIGAMLSEDWIEATYENCPLLQKHINPPILRTGMVIETKNKRRYLVLLINKQYIFMNSNRMSFFEVDASTFDYTKECFSNEDLTITKVFAPVKTLSQIDTTTCLIWSVF